MGALPVRVRSISCALSALVCVSAAAVGAEPAPRKPTVVWGNASTAAGLLTASATGAVVELPSRAYLRLSPNASVRVFPVPQLLALLPGAKSSTWSFALQSGRVDVDMPKAGRNAVLASLGKLSAIVTTGHATFKVEGAEAIASNPDGEVRTLLNDRWQTVPRGWLATLSKEDPNATPKPTIPGPTLTSTQRMWLGAGETIALQGFRWAPVVGAHHYELQVRRLPDGKVMAQASAEKPELSESFAQVQPGKYSVALRSVDTRGMEGTWSAESELRVIGVVLPPGGYSADGAIYIGTNQQVQFTNTAGLEMTYLGAGHYFPAAQGASLFRGEKTVIGFRMPGALDTAIARLEPRSVYADVHIGPQRAIWPRDTVAIDIQLKSKPGTEVPAFIQLVPTVSLGLDRVDVKFEQNGNTLHGVMPPSDRPGPWIVRVDVADQYGVALGHDFLEIATQTRKKPAAVRIIRTPGAAGPAQEPTPAAEPPVASAR